MADENEDDSDLEGSFMPRARRMSVKRISQQAKEEMAKQSIEKEASMRRTSMAQHVSETPLPVSEVPLPGLSCCLNLGIPYVHIIE